MLDVRPRGRNQDKPVRYCVASCINIWDEETRSSITSWVRTAGSGHRHYCNHPKCRFKGRCETNYGTTGFWAHLKVAHCVVKNQPQLTVAKDVKAVIPYMYDEEASLRKFYLAIVMHEYQLVIYWFMACLLIYGLFDFQRRRLVPLLVTLKLLRSLFRSCTLR